MSVGILVNNIIIINRFCQIVKHDNDFLILLIINSNISFIISPQRMECNHLKLGTFLLIDCLYLEMQTLTEDIISCLINFQQLIYMQIQNHPFFADKTWLFMKRLEFTDQQQQIASRKFGYQLSQELFYTSKRNDGAPIKQPICSQEDIEKIYRVFNALVWRCRFNQKNLENTFNKSRNEFKAKKNIKEVEKQCKNKGRKVVELIKRPEQEEEHWKTVLNHKNIIEHIHKAMVFLKCILEMNFELIKEGAAHIKNEKLPKQLQIRICIMVIDLITLINTMKFVFLPTRDDKPESRSKVELQQQKLLNDALEDEDNGFALVNNIDIHRFFETIQRIAREADNKTFYYYKVWVSIFNIRKIYLIYADGLWKRKFDSTSISEILLYWIQLYNEFFNFGQETSMEGVFQNVFDEYRTLFHFQLQQATKKEEKTENVMKCLDLMKTVWIKIDETSTSQLFWEEIALISNKITLPISYISQSKQFIVRIATNIIKQFSTQKNQQFLNKLRSFNSDLATKLISLQTGEDIVEHYIIKEQRSLRLLLTERNALNEAFEGIYKMIEDVSESKLLANIKVITHKIGVEIKNVNYLMNAVYEKQVISSLYETYQQDHCLIDEIKNFSQLSKFFSCDEYAHEEMEQCRNYYAKKRQKIVAVCSQSETTTATNAQQSIELIDSIKIITYELILNIKLNMSSKQLNKLKKIIYKLLEVYKNKKNVEIQDEQQKRAELQEQFSKVNDIFLRRVSSLDINPDHFNIDLSDDSSQNENELAINFIRKIFELRIDMINKNLQQLDAKEVPFKQEYMDIKQKMYALAARGCKEPKVLEDIKKLPNIEYNFLRRRYFKAWRQLRDLSDIESINRLLEIAWDGKRCILKLFISLLLKYRSHLFQSSIKNRDLQESDIDRLVTECLSEEHQNNSLKRNDHISANMKKSIRVLENFQKLVQLKKQKSEQEQRLNSIEEAKIYRTQLEQIKFKAIEPKLQVHSIFKNQTPILRKYVLKLEDKEFDEVYKKLKKLTQLNRNISLQTFRKKNEIVMKIDHVQASFDCYPKMVKHLIECYVEVVQFCYKHLNFEFYPLLLYNHIKINKKNQHHPSIKINQYEGILLNILMNCRESELKTYYRYPMFPFVELSEQLDKKFQKDKIYEGMENTSEFYAFKHLVEEMKSISMEVEGADFRQTAKRILKCPYFWSSTDKLFQIVEFKERYQSNINVEESRRKQNIRLRMEMKTEEEKKTFTYFPVEDKHPLYKAAYGNHKSTQVYFSIEGLLEKQAFEEDIGNFKGQNHHQEYKYHAFWWSKEKFDIKRLIEMVAERERKKGCNKSNFYEKTFNSFQNLIRNLRNLAVHHIYDKENEKEIDLEDKITIFENNFPKLFVFLYRWRPYLGKDYINDIRPEKVRFLKEVFGKDSHEVVQRLEGIKELQEYNLKNNMDKNYLLNLFGFDFAKVNGCQPCKILCNSLKKQNSFWSFLIDVKRQNYKEGKDMSYNILFWEHQKKGCNGMQYLILPYFNVTQRNHFTTEEYAHVKSSLTLMQVERERLDKKIAKELERRKRKGFQKEEEEESSPQSEDESVEIEKKESAQKKFKRLSINELDKLHDDLLRSDYVCKYFIFQLQMQFPYMFYDLRKERYQWDERACRFTKK